MEDLRPAPREVPRETSPRRRHARIGFDVDIEADPNAPVRELDPAEIRYRPPDLARPARIVGDLLHPPAPVPDAWNPDDQSAPVQFGEHLPEGEGLDLAFGDHGRDRDFLQVFGEGVRREVGQAAAARGREVLARLPDAAVRL